MEPTEPKELPIAEGETPEYTLCFTLRGPDTPPQALTVRFQQLSEEQQKRIIKVIEDMISHRFILLDRKVLAKVTEGLKQYPLKEFDNIQQRPREQFPTFPIVYPTPRRNEFIGESESYRDPTIRTDSEKSPPPSVAALTDPGLSLNEILAEMSQKRTDPETKKTADRTNTLSKWLQELGEKTARWMLSKK